MTKKTYFEEDKMIEKINFYFEQYKKENSDVITIKSYEKFRVKYPDAPSVYYVMKCFGGWRIGCEKSNLRPGFKYSEREVLATLREASSFLGVDVSYERYRMWAKKNGQISPKVLLKRFGTWADVLKVLNGIHNEKESR
ncbi:hypothetical protein EXIGUO8H_380004 [Exiguobacterium sp. 8H]|uniref:hypothetical protein n=1 Tax=unclassified Exiguobacterium TaxID=2644629 RepID=UPI0012F086D8|nr:MULTISPECIES: hypothetical protein [unclassified Exiguobacterium]VXB83808.1 hypothetical protein EXIGUO8H_380004 [Exiguobacterium sp. 8H]VXB97071.1 hypothetical protein EXIGUO8A_370003 [Exiguobacterium sp. 8A]